MGKIVSINVSGKKKVSKKPTSEATLIAGLGIEGDAHAAPGDRQVSLLMMESIQRQRELLAKNSEQLEKHSREAKIDILVPGVYAENLTVGGIDFLALKIGDEMIVEGKIILRVSKIGKECHTKCAIYTLVGDCVMPREGIFCEVIQGGVIKPGDNIELH